MNATTSDTNALQGINKVIEISSREWFDRSGGNTYFAAYVTVWTSTEFADAVRYVLPFQYGHDSQAKFTALRELLKLGVIDTEREHELRAAGVLVTFAKSDRPKRDLPTVSFCQKMGMPQAAPNVAVFIA